MYRSWFIRISIAAALLAVLLTSTSARDALDQKLTDRPDLTESAAFPYRCIAEHNVGKLVLSVAISSSLGTGFYFDEVVDCFTGEPIQSCEFPGGSNTTYLFGAGIWIGAVVGSDTLVSEAVNGWRWGQELYGNDNMIYRSTLDPGASTFPGAVSEQDYIAACTDTFTDRVPPDEIDGRPHLPLPVQAWQSSYAWSYPYSEDFVLLDYRIRNIGGAPLENVYVGFFVDGDVERTGELGFMDDLTGFIGSWYANAGSCSWTKTLNAGWIADNDGDYAGGGFAVPNVTGMRMLRTPTYSTDVAYNWWVSNGNPGLDFGPQHKDHLRYLVGGVSTGTPSGDRNKYFVMSNGEIDYNQIYTRRIAADDPLWAYPNQTVAYDITDGQDTKYLLSSGPFDLNPGQTVPVTMAYVGGEYLHVDPYNFQYNLSAGSYNPDVYYDNLNFADFAYNCMWAEWIYDNPGLDTDGDGYSGEYVICEGDTIWTAGDGVPDFQGASPPPVPKIWVEPLYEGMRIRWNGLRSETTPDAFSRDVDFEGYNVYLSRNPTYASYTEVASYDILNYNKYVYNLYRGEWELRDLPFTPRELRCLYAASCDDMTFDPRDYPRFSPYILPGFPDSLIAFEPFGANRSDLGPGSRVHRIYPDQPYPTSLDPAQANADELTEDGYLKYFEYEVILNRLVGGACYYVNVTVTDHGSPRAAVGPLETSRIEGAIHECALGDIEVGLDIMYWQCPNELELTLLYEKTDEEEGNPRGGNKLLSAEPEYIRSAILGGPDFDVRLIDHATVRLHTWETTDIRVFDVATPVAGPAEMCDCNTLQQDGYEDLIFSVIKPFGLLVPTSITYGDQIPLTVSGRMLDGRGFVGKDCVLLTRAGSTVTESGGPQLIGNYPNPFNPGTKISFLLPSAGVIRLEVYNITGQKVTTLVDGFLEAGYHTVDWDGTDVASGVYVYRLEAGGVTDSKKMLLVK